MKKELKKLLIERPDLDLSGSSFDEILQLLLLVREKTIEECIEKGYGLYCEDKFDYNPSIVSINKESLEKLDKNSIEL